MRTFNKFLYVSIPCLLFTAVALTVLFASPPAEAEPAASPGATTRISVANGRVQANGGSFEAAISGDERYVAFASGASNLVGDDANSAWDVFVHDRLTGQTERVSVSSSGGEGNNNSHAPDLSADGRYVAFESVAATLVPTDTNNAADIFVHDRQTRHTVRVSDSDDGTQGNGPATGHFAAAGFSDKLRDSLDDPRYNRRKL